MAVYPDPLMRWDLAVPRSAEKPVVDEKAKILLVDDRSENLVAMMAVLEPLGETLLRANSGREALRLMLRHDFAVILMDAQMPDMDGFETASIIRQRERNRHVPIIFVTAYGKDAETMLQGYSVGAVDYIAKPFNAEILRYKVRVFIELYKRGEEIKRQTELLRQSELREKEQEHIRRLNIELEERVQERTRELQDANEELEAFCYSVSHDLRAPLRAILSTSRILLDEAANLESQDREMLERQAAAAKRMSVLIDDLLQLSRLGRRTMERREFDLSALVREVVEEVLAREWEKPPTIEVEDGLRIVGDKGLLAILFENLLENACKYSPQGGCIRVGRDDEGFFVRDEGVGFDMQYSHKLFLPFERLVHDHEYPGTGIGLANVDRIIRRHGGRIWAESKIGEGSVFRFTVG
ncbi:MAG: sensor histidine kinase [Fimbriimonas sp.]